MNYCQCRIKKKFEFFFFFSFGHPEKLFAPALPNFHFIPCDISKSLSTFCSTVTETHGCSETADSPVSCLDDVDKDLTTVERCLADSLVLLAEQQVGAAKMWLLPQTQWKEGETLRQTAERALASLPGNMKHNAADILYLIFTVFILFSISS